MANVLQLQMTKDKEWFWLRVCHSDTSVCFAKTLYPTAAAQHPHMSRTGIANRDAVACSYVWLHHWVTEFCGFFRLSSHHVLSQINQLFAIGETHPVISLSCTLPIVWSLHFSRETKARTAGMLACSRSIFAHWNVDNVP